MDLINDETNFDGEEKQEYERAPSPSSPSPLLLESNDNNHVEDIVMEVLINFLALNQMNKQNLKKLEKTHFEVFYSFFLSFDLTKKLNVNSN